MTRLVVQAYRFLTTDRGWILMRKISHLGSHRLQPFLTTR
jgi:hypothetical protein